MFIASQSTAILTFFLSRNIRIARDRVYEQTIVSRGKGPEFWKPYVEEWDVPPPVPKRFTMARILSTGIGRTLFKRACVTPPRSSSLSSQYDVQ